MGYRELVDIEKRIIDATRKLGAAEGIDGISARKIAAECGISDFTVFRYFGTRENLLERAARDYNLGILQKICEYNGQNVRVTDLWDLMMQELCENSDGALFYSAYMHDIGSDPTLNNSISSELLTASASFLAENSSLTSEQLLLRWNYLTTMALYYAEKFVRGLLPNTPEIRAEIKKMVFQNPFD